MTENILRYEENHVALKVIKYEDNYVQIGESSIKIKFYFFPTAKSKTIQLNDIREVYWCRQQPHFQIMPWGMSPGDLPIWWAHDARRTRRATSTQHFRASNMHCNVIIDNGEDTLKGFTVENVDLFVRALRHDRPCSAKIFAESMPF